MVWTSVALWYGLSYVYVSPVRTIQPATAGNSANVSAMSTRTSWRVASFHAMPRRRQAVREILIYVGYLPPMTASRATFCSTSATPPSAENSSGADSSRARRFVSSPMLEMDTERSGAPASALR